MLPKTNTLKKNFYLYLYFLIVFISFLLGFFFNEDSSGGGLVDFKHEWTSIQEFKLGINSAVSIEGGLDAWQKDNLPIKMDS